MAELSDSDKKTLLGAGYKDAQTERDLKTGETDQVRVARARDTMMGNAVMFASGLGIIAFLIGLANFYSRGTPYSPTLVIGCAGVVIACMAVTVGLSWYRKSYI